MPFQRWLRDTQTYVHIHTEYPQSLLIHYLCSTAGEKKDLKSFRQFSSFMFTVSRQRPDVFFLMEIGFWFSPLNKIWV